MCMSDIIDDELRKGTQVLPSDQIGFGRHLERYGTIDNNQIKVNNKEDRYQDENIIFQSNQVT